MNAVERKTEFEDSKTNPTRKIMGFNAWGGMLIITLLMFIAVGAVGYVLFGSREA